MGDRSRSRRPRDGLTAALWIVLIGLLVTGGLAAALAATNTHDEAARNEEEIAQEVQRDLEATVSELRASLSGAQALVDIEGEVSTQRFDRFAKDVLNDSTMAAMALDVPVTREERSRYERVEGTPITDQGPDGDFVPAPDRDEYIPVKRVQPSTPDTDRLVGFDLASDDVRRETTVAARDSGTFMISPPVRAASTAAQWSSFIVQPLYRTNVPLDTPEQRRDASIGFLTSGVPGYRIIDRTRPLLPPGVQFSIVDDGVPLGSTTDQPLRDHTVEASIGGRTWQLGIDDGRDPNYGLAWLIAFATVLLSATIGFVLWQRITAQRARAAEAERNAQNAVLAQRLAEARTTTSVAAAIRDEVPPLLGASAASLRVVDQPNGVLSELLDEGVDPQVSTEYDAIPIDDATPAGRAVAHGSWILLTNLAREAPTYGEELVQAFRALDMSAMACVPLRDDEDQVIALLGVVWDRPRSFDANTTAMLRTIAEISEQTLERARLHDSEHQLVTELQNSALQLPPEIEGLDIAVRYRSAGQTLTMGGDWYDAIPLGDGSVALVVGDVAGHGMAAVAEMIELRSIIGALLRSGQSLADVLAGADDALLASRDTRMATVAIAVIDVPGGGIRYASAGHPPSLLRDPDGTVAVLMDGRRPVVGMRPTMGWSVAERPFPPGAAYISYTDGLIERRDEDLGISLDRLAAHLREAPAGSEDLADELLGSSLDGAAAADDVALVVITANADASTFPEAPASSDAAGRPAQEL